jgi:hypothetical protein
LGDGSIPGTAASRRLPGRAADALAKLTIPEQADQAVG